jgi:hypothetical protein
MVKSKLIWAGFLFISLAIVGLLVVGIDAWLKQGSPEYLTDRNIIIEKKLLSTDGSKIAIDYYYDNGALGDGAGHTALLSANQMRSNLRKFRISDRYEPIRWEDDGSLTVRVDYIECIRANEDCAKARDAAFGTRINIQNYDETDGKSRVIEAEIPSPSGRRLLVAYRYPNGPNLGRIHVSIVESGQLLPRYGNFYIASMEGDGILDAHWETDSSIVLLTKTSQAHLLQNPTVFRPNPPNIDYRIEIDDSLSAAYLWTKVPIP